MWAATVCISPNCLALGGLSFVRQGRQILLCTPDGAAAASQNGFVRGVQPLWTMGMELEGQAGREGGFVFRAEGARGHR